MNWSPCARSRGSRTCTSRRSSTRRLTGGLESKSLKLYLSSFRNEGVFCEALAVKIRDDVAEALGLAADAVQVSLTQKARGGITSQQSPNSVRIGPGVVVVREAG